MQAVLFGRWPLRSQEPCPELTRITLNRTPRTSGASPPPPILVHTCSTVQSISDHHSDFRLRSLYGVWVAPPAVMMLAYASLEQLTSLDAVQRLLFCEWGRHGIDLADMFVVLRASVVGAPHLCMH